VDRDRAASASIDRPTFESIVETTLAQSPGSPARQLLPHLQYAQAALVRGNNSLGRERFLKLRDRLVRQKEPRSEDAAYVARMLQYVEFQLGRLK
jgi:hypothetical protein